MKTGLVEYGTRGWKVFFACLSQVSSVLRLSCMCIQFAQNNAELYERNSKIYWILNPTLTLTLNPIYTISINYFMWEMVTLNFFLQFSMNNMQSKLSLKLLALFHLLTVTVQRSTDVWCLKEGRAHLSVESYYNWHFLCAAQQSWCLKPIAK